MLKKICVIYRRGGVTSAVKILAPNEAAARKVFYSHRMNYAGCGVEVLGAEEYNSKTHDRLLAARGTEQAAR